MKRSQRPSSSPAVPTVRALPPQKRSITDTPGLRPALRITGGVAVALLILGGACGAVVALDRGALPPIAIPLASLSVLAATAAYLAGRNDGKRETATSADRSRAKGRLQKGAAAAKARAAGGNSAESTLGADTANGAAAALAWQAGTVALRTKFLDEISQALRAPITSMCLAARIIRKHYDSTPEVVAHFGDTLLAEADRLGQTVDEFLELARLESGVIEWHEDEVDAADLIQRAVAEVESVAVSYGVSVAFTMEPALPQMHVDRERVTQTLTILLAMAVRSASEGSEIVIQIAGAHGGWVFTVGGTSFVYPHSEARKVHARAESSQPIEQPEALPDGSGLGLCLCREIVTRYQGRLWIEGTPGASGCARFTLPYRQHRRAVAATAASAIPATSVAAAASTPIERALQTAPTEEPAACNRAAPSPDDLEQRREAAVRALRDRAAAQPRVDAIPEAGEAETRSSDDSASSATPADATEKESQQTTTATSTAAASEAAGPVAERAPSATGHEARTSARASAKISFGRRQTTAEPTAHARPVPAPKAAREANAEATRPNVTTNEQVAAIATPSPEPEIEVEIDDAPVHAPVSGTMITATHRTAGPPVLANPGVPALSGVQSAASAAMQGSDELLLEIAEAQSPDGRSLVVSEEVRSLLASAPGTLPAVAGQNAPAGTGRSSYTPSRRRMVQAPWVVRPGTDEGQNAGPDTTPSAAAEQESATGAAGAQRARLNERLAKRLGLTGSAQGDRTGPSGTPASGAYLRSRRLGSR